MFLIWFTYKWSLHCNSWNSANRTQSTIVINKTKAILWEKVWSPKMSSYVENLVENHVMLVTFLWQTNNQIRITRQEIQTYLGTHLTTSWFCSIIVVSVMKTGITSTKIIPKLTKPFYLFGYPDTIILGNGKQYMFIDFIWFLLPNNMKNQPVSSYLFQANKKFEISIKHSVWSNEISSGTLKFMQRASSVQGKEWRDYLDKFLLQYIAMPHTATGVPLSDLLLKRKTKNDIPSRYSQNSLSKN